MAQKPVKKQRPKLRRSGTFPDEFNRRSLVTTSCTCMKCQFREMSNDFLSHDGETDHEEQNYVVKSRKFGGRWTHSVEYKGEVWNFPYKVIQRLQQQRDAIGTEERRLRGFAYRSDL
jgi:hypothetical protein